MTYSVPSPRRRASAIRSDTQGPRRAITPCIKSTNTLFEFLMECGKVVAGKWTSEDKHMVAKSGLWILLVAGLILPEVARAQERPTVIRATTLLDGKGGVTRNVSIVVQATRITRIERAAQGTTYDLKGLTVMPGWIDTHVHIDAHFDPSGKSHDAALSRDETPEQTMLYAVENAYNVLMAGFTTVQSVGSPGDRDLRNAIARGTIPGPRLLTSLRPVNETTGTPEEIRAFVRQVVADGADLIKIFATKSIREGGGPILTQAQVDAACGEATSLGKRAIVHAQGPEGARAAVLAGLHLSGA